MEITINDLIQVRNYFGEHDKTPFEHRAFTILDCLIKQLKDYEHSDKILKPNELRAVNRNEAAKEFAENLEDMQEDIDSEYVKIVNDNLDSLLANDWRCALNAPLRLTAENKGRF